MPRPRFTIDIREVDAFIEKCRVRQRYPRIGKLAALLKVSRVTLSRRFFERYGIHLSVYIANAVHTGTVRLLLDNPDLSQNDVSYFGGYQSRRTLYRKFKSREKTTPGRFRRRRTVTKVKVIKWPLPS